MKARVPKGYGGMGGGNRNDMMRKAQKIQEEMARAQEELEQEIFTATTGGGMVEAKVSGKKELVSIEIKPEAVDPEDVEMLQDLIISAVNEGMRQADAKSEETIGSLTGGLSIPGMF